MPLLPEPYVILAANNDAPPLAGRPTVSVKKCVTRASPSAFLASTHDIPVSNKGAPRPA